MKLRILFVLLAGLLLLAAAGCNDRTVTVTKYDGTVLVGQLVSGDFESEELVIRMPDNRDLLLRFNEIKRIEMGAPRR